MRCIETRRFLRAVTVLYLCLSCRNGDRILAQNSSEQGPKDITVLREGTAIFECNLSGRSFANVFWHYESESGVDRFLSRNRQVGVNPTLPSSLQNRLAITGDISQKEFTLRIESVTEADRGKYTCYYVVSESGELFEVGSAELTVLALPSQDSPECDVEHSPGTASISPEVGSYVTLVCRTYGGNPVPTVVYFRRGERVTGPARSISHQYRLLPKDNGVIFTCAMSTLALGDELRNCSVMPLRITPNATVRPTAVTIEEGATQSFECRGDGVPEIAGFSWTVTYTDTGAILPSERYTVQDGGRSLELRVHENLELLCIVSVPSGLSGNSSARVEVIKRDFAVPTSDYNQTDAPSPSSSSALVIVIVLLIVAVALIGLFLALFLWQRKRHRKSRIPIDPKYGYQMRDIGDEFGERPGGELRQEARNVQPSSDKENDVKTQPGGGAPPTHPLYAVPDRKDKGNKTIYEESDDKTTAFHAKPDKRTRNDRYDKTPPSTPVDTNGRLPPAESLYAKPNKQFKNSKENVCVNDVGDGHNTQDPGEPNNDDSGLTYADLDLTSPSLATTDNTVPHPGLEQTVYASIRT